MNKKSPRPLVRFGIQISFLVVLLLILPANLNGQCSACYNNLAILQGHGPAGILTGDPYDARRVIKIVINNLGVPDDPKSWYDPSTGGPNQTILTALQNARDNWNNANVGYYFDVSSSQNQSDLDNADVIVTKEDVGGDCAGIEPYTGHNLPLHLMLPPDASTRNLPRLTHTLTHEYGHLQLLTDAGERCFGGYTVMTPTPYSCDSAFDPTLEASLPTASDISVSNFVINNGNSACGGVAPTGRDGPIIPTCDPSSPDYNPCDTTCPNYSPNNCPNFQISAPFDFPFQQCYERWIVIDYYSCNSGGCVFLYRELTDFLGIVCY